MSATVLAVLIVAAACCLVLLTALFAAMQAAARGDRALERATFTGPRRTLRQVDATAEEALAELGLPRTRRFARRRVRPVAAANDKQDSSVTR